MTNANDHLAHLRTVWALERTQLAWVRTAFSMIAGGLAVDKGTAALHGARLLENPNWLTGSHIGGITLVIAASMQLAAAMVITIRRNQELARIYHMPAASLSLVLPLSIFVIAVGVLVAALLTWWG